MTRYARYTKTFNAKGLKGERAAAPREADSEGLTAGEVLQIAADKEQSVEVLSLSTNMRSKPVCLKCRSRRHTVRDCPQGAERTICYNCGSKEHTLKACREPRREAALTFASCFICKQQGHISNQCPQNTRGIYPRGGGCRFCGSNKHLARDCRPAKVAAGEPLVDVCADPHARHADDDLVFSALRSIQGEKGAKRAAKAATEGGTAKKKKAKVVTF